MASQNIGNLKVNIGADTKDLARGIGRAKALFGGLARTAKMAGVAAAASFTAASVGMAAMTKQGLSFVDSQAKTARSVDGTIDGLRALQIATGDAGVALDEISRAVQIMGKRIAEADRDGFGPAHEALEMIGLTASDLMAMDIDARFATIADRVRDLGMNAQQAGDLMRQFGVRSNEVSLVLLQGGDAIRAARGEVQKFGLAISEDMAAKVEIANDAMSRIGFVFEGMRNQLAVGLAPVLQDIAVKLQEASTAGGPLQTAITQLTGAFAELATAILDPAFLEAATLFGTTIAGAVAGLSRVMIVLADNAEIAGSAMIALGAAMAWFSGPIGLAIAAVSAGVFLLSTRLEDSVVSAHLAQKAYEDLHAALGEVDRSNAAAVASGEALIATHIDQARAAIEAARAELALARSKEKAGNALLDENPITAGGNSGYAEAMAENTAAREAELNAAEAQLVKYQKTLEGFKRSQFPSRGSRPTPDAITPDAPGGGGDPLGVEKLNSDLSKLINVIDPATAKAEKFKEAMRLLTKAKQAGIITDDEYIARARQINETFGETPEKTGAAVAGIRAVSRELKKSEDAAIKTDEGWETTFGNLIRNIDQGTDALKNFALEAVKMLAIRGISKILGGTSWFDGPLIGENALGTDNWRGGLSWVGERGPELVNLPRGAQVIPNNKIGQIGGGGMSFTYAPNIDAKGASLAAVQELDGRMRADAAQFQAKVEQAVMKAKTKRTL